MTRRWQCISGFVSRRRIGHFAYWSALTIVFACAAWLRFRLPLDPIADPDTWGYLSPAIRKLTGGQFGHTQGRNFVYPAFVYLVLRAFGDFRAITIIQHLLGLLAGGVFLLTWRRVRDFIPNAQLPCPIHRWLGLLAAAIYLFAREPLHVEMCIRPESVCGFLISINLYFVLRFTACGFLEDRRTAAILYGTGVVLISIVLGSVKPSFWLAAVVALLPIAMFFFRADWLWQKIALIGGAAASATLLLLPEHILSRNDRESRMFLPTTLFVIHADLILDQMARDLQFHAKLPYPREWIKRIHASLSEEIAKSHAAWPTHYATLGFDPDYLMYSDTSIGLQLQKDFGDNVTALCRFYRFYYWRIWMHQPLLLIKKVMRQMAIFYAPKCPVYRLYKSHPLGDEYKQSATSLGVEEYRKIWSVYPPAIDFMNRTELLARSAPVIKQLAFLRRSLGILAATYLTILLIALVLSAAVFLHQKMRRRLGWLAAIVVFAYAYNAAYCLEVAVVHSLQYPRYLTVQMYFVILAQFLATLLILEVLLGSRVLIGKEWRRSEDCISRRWPKR